VSIHSFFSEFDGEWKVTPVIDPTDPSQVETKVEYLVDVRPKGPVPVAALEWRIREDVPTNLRAVKLAAVQVGKKGVEELQEKQRRERNGGLNRSRTTTTTTLSSNTNTNFNVNNNNSYNNNYNYTNGSSSSRIQNNNIQTSRGRLATVGTATTRNNNNNNNRRNLMMNTVNSSNVLNGVSQQQQQLSNKRPVTKLAPVRVQWYEDETMAAYLKKKP
jgi:hypothetical protein